MIITILTQKYRCGSNKGMNCMESEGLLNKINSIIEWDFSKKIVKSVNSEGKKEEKKEDIPEDERKLKPGMSFITDGQLIAIDTENKIYLITSETGVYALNRLYNDVISVEYEIKSSVAPEIDLTWEESDTVPENYVFEKVEYKYFSMFNNIFIYDRISKPYIKCKVNMMGVTFNIVLGDWGMYYNPTELEGLDKSSTLNYMSSSLIKWFLKNYSRKSYVTRVYEKDGKELNNLGEEEKSDIE